MLLVEKSIILAAMYYWSQYFTLCLKKTGTTLDFRGEENRNLLMKYE